MNEGPLSMITTESLYVAFVSGPYCGSGIGDVARPRLGWRPKKEGVLRQCFVANAMNKQKILHYLYGQKDLVRVDNPA
jgi:hypothetical protein